MSDYIKRTLANIVRGVTATKSFFFHLLLEDVVSSVFTGRIFLTAEIRCRHFSFTSTGTSSKISHFLYIYRLWKQQLQLTLNCHSCTMDLTRTCFGWKFQINATLTSQSQTINVSLPRALRRTLRMVRTGAVPKKLFGVQPQVEIMEPP